MGECMYFLKAQFPKGILTKKRCKEIRDFFKEGEEADKSDWSDEELKKKFPTVAEYLETSDDGDIPLYDLNGSEVEERLYVYAQSGSKKHNDMISYQASISHMANWSALAFFLKKKFGAMRVVWDNEENGCGSLDGLNLYDYEDIVQAILHRKKALLPGLLGAHDELDILIHMKLKG